MRPIIDGAVRRRGGRAAAARPLWVPTPPVLERSLGPEKQRRAALVASCAARLPPFTIGLVHGSRVRLGGALPTLLELSFRRARRR
jgi:hypothetical protein